MVYCVSIRSVPNNVPTDHVLARKSATSRQVNALKPIRAAKTSTAPRTACVLMQRALTDVVLMPIVQAPDSAPPMAVARRADSASGTETVMRVAFVMGVSATSLAQPAPVLAIKYAGGTAAAQSQPSVSRMRTVLAGASVSRAPVTHHVWVILLVRERGPAPITDAVLRA